MTSQHGKAPGKATNYPIQLHLAGGSTSVSRSGINLNSVQFVNPNLGVPLKTTPLHAIESSTVLPLQLSGSNISFPIQLSSANQMNVTNNSKNLNTSLLSRVTPNLPVQLTNIRGTSNSIIQLQMVSPHNEDKMNEDTKYNKVEACTMPMSSAHMMEQTTVTSIPSKLQDPACSTSYQLASNHRQILSNNAIQVSVSSSKVQMKTQPRGIYYIQKTGYKPVASTDTVVTNTTQLPSPIIVRKPPTTSGIQFLSPSLTKPTVSAKATTVTKCAQLAPKISTQSLVVQKSTKIPQSIVPVSIAAKNSISIPYVNPVKKMGNQMKSSENQSLLLPGSNLSSGVNSGNQKILVPFSKLTTNNKIILPVGIDNNLPTTIGSSYNFQINNGKQTDDTPSNLSLLGSLASSVNDVPPLQPFSKNLQISRSGIVTQSTSSETNFSNDNAYSHAISGTRAEAINDQEYSLSIPETNDSMNDDLYTVSISDNNDVNYSTEQSFTIPIPEKVKSLISKSSMSESVSNEDGDINLNISSVPAILRRSNSENNERKNINSRRRISLTADKVDSNNRPDKVYSKFDNLNFYEKPKVVISLNEEKPVSLICNENLEIDMDSDLRLTKRMNNDKAKNGVNILTQSTIINKDRRKSRMSSEVNHLIENPSENTECNNSLLKVNNNIKQRKENFGLDYIMNDAPGLNWQNGIAHLNGSDLVFNLNEFGVIDLVDKKVENGTKSYKQNSDFNREKKSMSPDDLYCCNECGCHGMAAEFVNPNFCSNSCQQFYERKVRMRKEKVISDIKKKKKQKKVVGQKRNTKEHNEFIAKENLVFESHSLDYNDDDDRLLVDDSEMNKNIEDSLPNKNSWICSKSGFSWMKYLEYYKVPAVPDKFFKDISINKNGFRKGMKLEAIDPVHPSIFAVVTIANIQGHRLCLHFDGYNDEYDFWVNVDSYDIFPAGWCEKNKRSLKTPIGFDNTSFSWNIYLRQCKAIAAPKNLFLHLPDLHPCPNGFRVGMKLEAQDRKHFLNCVATVSDVINNRILIHFDSWDDIYDYWVDPTSPYIHPVGWCDENGFSLTPPNSYANPEDFSWDEYLFKERASAVPQRAFKPRPPIKLKTGMKLEAVDKRVPFLIRVATISDVRSHQIRISFDGWPDELSYWVEDDSPDIHPVGWCLKTGHCLEPPLSMEEIQVLGECGTYGCRGLGNMSSAKLSSHFTAADCPYKLPPKSPILLDRLDGIRPPPEHLEPRPREPRKLEEIIQAHKRRHEDDIKSEIMISDDECMSFSKRKRELSSITQDKVQFSVFEPGYTPNPNKVTLPYWGKNCLSLKDILQKESFRVDPRNWNQAEVIRFIGLVAKCSDFSCEFSKHSIDGESFLMLSQEDLTNVLGMRLGPAIKIYNIIIQLRQKILS